MLSAAIFTARVRITTGRSYFQFVFSPEVGGGCYPMVSDPRSFLVFGPRFILGGTLSLVLSPVPGPAWGRGEGVTLSQHRGTNPTPRGQDREYPPPLGQNGVITPLQDNECCYAVGAKPLAGGFSGFITFMKCSCF